MAPEETWVAVVPLHVKIAEALLWTDLAEKTIHLPEWPEPRLKWFGRPSPHARPEWFTDLSSSAARCAVPLYDRDWSATGPLIERYRIIVYPNSVDYYDGVPLSHAELPADYDPRGWKAYGPGTALYAAQGPTPLVAVCHLLLELAAAGKL